MKKRLLASLATGLLVGSVSSASALSLDLTTAGASGWIGTAFFEQVSDQSTGTGVIDPFLRIQANGLEQGYNTNGTVEWDTKSGYWTHALALSTVPVVQISGEDYYQFLLDINEVKSQDGPFLSLNALQLYIGNNPNVTGTNLSALGTKFYDLGVGNVVELNYSLNPGSGAGDMYAYIPTTSLTGTYLFMYSAFGNPNSSSDGFEEWAVIAPPGTVVPEPATMLLFGTGLAGLAGIARRRKKN